MASAATPPHDKLLEEPEQCLSEELVNAPGRASEAEEGNTERLSELFPRSGGLQSA